MIEYWWPCKKRERDQRTHTFPLSHMWYPAQPWGSTSKKPSPGAAPHLWARTMSQNNHRFFKTYTVCGIVLLATENGLIQLFHNWGVWWRHYSFQVQELLTLSRTKEVRMPLITTGKRLAQEVLAGAQTISTQGSWGCLPLEQEATGKSYITPSLN
jgi:hypothetical protein